MAVSEIERLRQRYEQNPNGTMFASYAEALRKTGEVASALEVLKPGIERHPDYAPARIVQGRCALDVGDDALAESSFTHALSLDSENVIALKALADVMERQGRLDEAQKWLEMLLAVDRNNDEAREQLARMIQRRNTAPAPAPAPEPERASRAPETVREMVSPFYAPPPAEPESPPAAEADAPPAPSEPSPASAEATAPLRALVPELPAPPTAFAPPELVEEPEPEPVEEPPPPIGWVSTADPHEPLPAPLLPELEPTAHVAEAAPEPAPAPEGLEHTSFAIEKVESIDLQAAASNEFQEPAAAESLAVPTAPEAGLLDPPTGAAAPAPEPVLDPVPEPEPEPFLTETMAELYIRQGHTHEALGVYRRLLEREPENARFAARVAMLEVSAAAAPAEQEPPAPLEDEPSSTPLPAPVAVRPRLLATETGGTPLRMMLAEIVGARFTLPGEPPAVAESDVPVEVDLEAAPTRPASDPVSLANVFGEPAPAARAPATSGPSFDEFYGTRSQDAPAGEAAGSPEELRQFRAWLEGLKR